MGVFDKLASSVRGILSPYVRTGAPAVATFQRACGVPSPADVSAKASAKPRRGYWPAHLVFTFGAALGNELFYIIFLPFLFWQYDDSVARQAILMWAGMYYVGQALKDVLQLPRPADLQQGVVRLEAHYEAEYGAPSTHAMSAVSMPWILVIASHGNYADLPASSWAPVVFGLTWMITMTLSRLYMGVHYLVDIVTGIMVGACALASILLIGHAVDEFQLASPFAPLVAVVVTAVLSYLYPRPEKWVNSPGDSVLILGVANGVCIGSWLNYHAQVVATGRHPAQEPICVSCAFDMATTPIRVLFGVVVLFLTRAVFKSIFTSVALAVLPKSSVDPKKRYAVELPVKLITYSAIGINAVYLVPMLLEMMGFPKAQPHA